MNKQNDLNNDVIMWHVIDLQTGEIIFENPDQDRCINLALLIRKLAKYKCYLGVI